MPGVTLMSVGVPLAAGMLVVCLLGPRQPAGAAVALVPLVWVWLQVDRAFEGPVLFSLTADHGLVTADLFGLAVLGWALLLAVRAGRAGQRART